MSSVNEAAAVRLAKRLRELREHAFPDVTLTQVQLAKALSAQSKVAAPTLSTWENTANPKTPPTARLIAYARFFATHRSVDGVPHLLAVDELNDEERERFDRLEEELLELHTTLVDAPEEPAPPTRRRLLQFDDQSSIIIVCPEAPRDAQGALADEKDPNYTRLHRYADADALLELFGHVRALNPDRTVLHRLPSDTRKSDLQNHLIILGGIGWNSTLRQIQRRLGERLPITQFEDPGLPTGEVFRVRDQDSGAETTHFPVSELGENGNEFTEDVGLVARLANPFNSSRTLTICNGVHSTGVHGAVLTLTDETVRPANEEYLAERYRTGEFAMLVRVLIISNGALAPDLQDPGMRLFEWSPNSDGG